MNYVLAEITRRSIGFHYYREQNGNRAFVPYGSNGPIPLAISYLNGRYSLGKAAQMAVEEGQKEAYYNLFDINRNTPCCDGLLGGQLISKVITLLLEDLCKDKFYSSLAELAHDITLVLFYGNDISLEEIDRVRSELRHVPLAELKVIDHSQESVKFFHKSAIDDWSGETDGMVVMSDNQDLSVKCYSLSDYNLKYEHRFKGKGIDPRFEQAVNMLWETVKNDTYCNQEECLPIIKKALKDFLDSDKLELHSVKLPDGNWPVMLSRRQYDIYSPQGGNQFVTLAGDVVQRAKLRIETTGVVLQGYAADNKSFRDSFISFDPISQENEGRSREILNNLVSTLMGFEEVLEVDENVVECPWDGGSIMVGVKSLPKTQPFTASSEDEWIKTMVGASEIGIFGQPNDGNEERVGVVTLTSPYGKVTKTITVRQNCKSILVGSEPEKQKEDPIDPNDNGNRKFKITSEIVTSGSLFKKTKKLKVKVQILDDKALPFDCVFTLSKNYSIKFKPESMYYEKCERGARGELTFGPYTLPISALGNTDVIYAAIWPARQMLGNPLFRNNQLEIKL